MRWLKGDLMVISIDGLVAADSGSGFRPSNRPLGAPLPTIQQLPSDHVQVCQGKHRERPGEVLGDPAVAYFGEAPELLDHPKRVLTASPRARAARLIRRCCSVRFL